MLEAFQPELHDQSLAPGGENYYANPLGNRLLTQGTCWYGVTSCVAAGVGRTDKWDSGLPGL
jgi:hypothetical protein